MGVRGKAYLKRIDVGYVGQLSRVFEGGYMIVPELMGSSAVDPGKAAVLSSGKIVAYTSGATVYGWVLRAFPGQSQSWENSANDFNDASQWAPGFPVPVLRRGYFTTTIQSGAASKGGAVYVRKVALRSLVVGGIEDGTVRKATVTPGTNTGNGTCVVSDVANDVAAATLTLTMTSATAFTITIGGTAYTGVAGTLFSKAGVTLMVTAGGTAFVANDAFSIVVAVDTDIAAVTDALFTGPASADGVVEIAYRV